MFFFFFKYIASFSVINHAFLKATFRNYNIVASLLPLRATFGVDKLSEIYVKKKQAKNCSSDSEMDWAHPQETCQVLQWNPQGNRGKKNPVKHGVRNVENDMNLLQINWNELGKKYP